jgi:Raf kinase inhibitor-like YbhB/YbcL family protein
MRKNAVLLGFILACISIFLNIKDADSKNRGGKNMAISITSTAFTENGMIPRKYTCDDRDVSPALSWSNVPQNAKSIALICDDPDAPVGTWVHWVVFDMPATAKGLPEGTTGMKGLPAGAKQGINDFRKRDYGGPCPPSGTHRYFFKIYALDAMLDLKEGATKADLLKAMEGHILGQGQLMGRYSRS